MRNMKAMWFSFITLLFLVSAAIPGLAKAPDSARVYYFENFRNYTERAPGTLVGTVWNDPIWVNEATLSTASDKDTFIFEKFKPETEMPGFPLRTFDLSFRFKIDGKTSAPPFSVVFRGPGGEDSVLTVSRTSAAVSGIAKSASAEMEDVKAARCYFHMKVKDGKADLFMASSKRVFNKLISFDLPALKSFNIRLAPGASLELGDIALTSPVPLKDFSAKRLFADFKSIRDDIGFEGAEMLQSAELTGNGDGIKFRHGPKKDKPVTMSVTWSDGSRDVHNFTIQGEDEIRLGKMGRVRSRPAMRRFAAGEVGNIKVPAADDLKREWADLPKASEHPVDIDFRRLPDGSVNVLLDGNLLANLIKDASSAGPEGGAGSAVQKRVTPVNFTFDFQEPVQVKLKKPFSGVDASRYMVLDIGVSPKAKTFVNARSSLKAGRQTINGVPMVVVDPVSSSDVGICKMGVGNWAIEVEEYHGREAGEGYPSEIHYAIPALPYTKAWILCALDPDESKDPVLVTRFGRYMFNGSGGNNLADTVFEMPQDGSIPSSMKKVGIVKNEGVEVPLYLLEIPLNLGVRLDLSNGRYKNVSFEFVGKLWENFQQMDNSMKPDPDSTSSFQIFGVTLEIANASMDIRQAQPSNVFTADEKAETFVVLKALTDKATGSVLWSARDVEGMKVFSGKVPYSMENRGDAMEIAVPLKAGVGYYDLDITLTDERGSVLTHPARFAIVPKDVRKATVAQSPYGIWWFGNAHGGNGDSSLAGSVLAKAGIRKVAWSSLSRETSEKYNVVNINQMYLNLGEWTKLDDELNFPEKERTNAINFISAKLEENPNTSFLIWHESAPAYGIPEELLGLPVPTNDPAMQIRTERIGRFMQAVGKFRDQYFPRSKYPGMKIQIGNSLNCLGPATLPFRGGAKASDIDCIGIESPNQVVVPERMMEITIQGQVIGRDIFQRLTGEELKLNGCWEFSYRCERDMGEQQQAEWYMRDILISLANNYVDISPGVLFDVSSGYYNGLWGQSGMLQRHPYAYPKRAYVAYAALTHALDAVKFRRQVPTGSTTVYALEFERAHDKKLAVAIWASRGFADFNIEFDGKAAGSVFDMYGRERSLSGASITVNAGESPAYIVADKPVKTISLSNRSFPKDMKKAAKSRVASSFDDVALVEKELLPDPAVESRTTQMLPIMRPSDAFSISQADDVEKGGAIEVSIDLEKNPGISKYITEYTTLRLKEPAAVPGNPAAIGVWVKGNDNWGQVRFEIEDAEGEVFRSISTGGYGCDILDWPGNLCVNFEGWNMVAHPLRITSLFNDHSPGPVSDQWVSDGRGNKRIDLPVKVRAITVGMNRQKLDLLDFKPASTSIMLKDICGLEE